MNSQPAPIALFQSTQTGFEIVVLVAARPNTFSQHFFLKRRRKMKLNIFVFLIITIFVDIGLSMPLNHSRKKRQLGGTGVSFGKIRKL